jgi:hypothetical protein
MPPYGPYASRHQGAYFFFSAARTAAHDPYGPYANWTREPFFLVFSLGVAPSSAPCQIIILYPAERPLNTADTSRPGYLRHMPERVEPWRPARAISAHDPGELKQRVQEPLRAIPRAARRNALTRKPPLAKWTRKLTTLSYASPPPSG